MTKLVLTTHSFYEQFTALCASFSPAIDSRKVLIAYSGGLDSHVLLHLFASISKDAQLDSQLQLRSIYVDHGLQKEAVGWSHHCQQVANQLEVEHQSIQLHLKKLDGESLEAIARKARYLALQEQLNTDEILVTAHHQDDQAETLLLQLLRGAGSDGLAAMPAITRFANGYHMRPLLSMSRDSLENYAKENTLSYITDPSNKDNRFDRNYLRNEVVPVIKQRWPKMSMTLSRSARLQAETGQLLASYTDTDMVALKGTKANTLSFQAVNKLPLVKQKAVLRNWIKKSGFIAPSEIKLKHLVEDVLRSSVDANPLVAWQNVEVRRYRDDIYIMSILPPELSSEMNQPIPWDLTQALDMGNGVGVLNPDDLGELKSILLERGIPVTVRFRQGGERIRPKYRQHSVSLKNLLQEAGIPPWERSRLPLIFADELLISVPGLAQIDKKEL